MAKKKKKNKNIHKKKENKKKRREHRKSKSHMQEDMFFYGPRRIYITDPSPEEKFFKKLRSALIFIVLCGFIYWLYYASWSLWLKIGIAFIGIIASFIVPFLLVQLVLEAYYKNPVAIMWLSWLIALTFIWLGPFPSLVIWNKIVISIVVCFSLKKIVRWVFFHTNKNIGLQRSETTSIPEDIQEKSREIIDNFNKKILKKKAFYIADFSGDSLYLDRNERGDIEPICRLDFCGKIDNWEFSIYKHTWDDYDPDEFLFPGDKYVDGTIEGAMKAGLEAYPAKLF